MAFKAEKRSGGHENDKNFVSESQCNLKQQHNVDKWEVSRMFLFQYQSMKSEQC